MLQVCRHQRAFSFSHLPDPALLQPPQPLLDSFRPDVSPCPSLYYLVMVFSGCGEQRPYFPTLCPLKTTGLPQLQITPVQDGTYTTTQWELR